MGLTQDIKFGFRMLKKGGWISIAAVLILSLAIGVNTGIFSIVDRVLWRPLSYGSSEQLVSLWESYGIDGWGSVSPANFADWQSQNSMFSGLAAYSHSSRNLQHTDSPERLSVVSASASLFSLLQVQPLIGRTFVNDDALEGHAGVVVLSEGLWRRKFTADRNILGTTIILDGNPYAVIGVMPAGFEFPPASKVDLWTILQLEPAQSQARGNHFLSVVGRLKPGISLANAFSQMRDIAKRIEQQFPQQQKGRNVRMLALSESVTGGSRLPLLLLLGAVGFVLLIACADVASMLLARTAARNQELSVRLALGAPRQRLIRQLLIESLILAFISGCVALGVAVLCTRALASLAALQVPFIQTVQFDIRVFFVLFLSTILAGLIFGLPPGFQYLRHDALRGLKEGSTQVGLGRGLSRIYAVIVVVEVSLSVFLLIGSGLLVRTFLQLRSVEPGFEAANVLTAQISLSQKRYADGPAVASFYDKVLEQIKVLPGVRSAGLISLLPMQDWGLNASFGIQGRQVREASTAPTAEIRIVSPDYFEVLSIPLRAGRFIQAQDQATTPHAALINETLRRKYFPGENPVGHYLLLPDPWLIVGVVNDIKQTRLNRETLPELYLPYSQVNELPLLSDTTLVMKTNVSPTSLVGSLRGAIRSIDQNQPIYNVSTMREVVDRSVSGLRLYVFLATGFAVLALLLAIAGIYGVISYTTVQRTREFGLRIALGAQRADLLRLVVARYMAKVGLGLVAGVGGALIFSKILASVLFEVKPVDPLTYVASCLLVCAVSFVAGYIPARRASQLHPTASLRSE